VALQYEQPHSHVNRKPGRKKQQVDRCSWSEPEKLAVGGPSHTAPDESLATTGLDHGRRDRADATIAERVKQPVKAAPGRFESGDSHAVKNG
jgi:hypothetical protein